MSTITEAIPLLVYKDIAAAHDFLVNTFGFESGELARDAEGCVIHGEVRAGDMRIWLHRVAAEHELDSRISVLTTHIVRAPVKRLARHLTVRAPMIAA